MNKLFQNQPLLQQSFFQKLFRQIPGENSVIEINNLLASISIKEIKVQDIEKIISKYPINVFRVYKKNIYEFYATYLNYCLTDKFLSDVELDELNHLKNILNLNDKDVRLLHDLLVSKIYQKTYEDAISDGKLEEDEILFLEKIQSNLKLSESIANTISDEAREKYIKNFLENTVSDERLSPDEEKELELISKNLNLKMELDHKTKSLLEKYKLYWIIENLDLPSLDVEINLQKSEKCYFYSNIEWFEQRTVTKNTIYSGVNARIRIMKGVSYRVGNISANRITAEEWKFIDSGMVYLTNKRIIFMGQKKNSNIKINKILSFVPYEKGVEINKDTGRSPLLKFSENSDLFSLILSRLLKEE